LRSRQATDNIVYVYSEESFAAWCGCIVVIQAYVMAPVLYYYIDLLRSLTSSFTWRLDLIRGFL